MKGGSRPIWIFAAVLAISLHAALGAYAITHLRDSDETELGAPGIVIDVELASPKSEATDLPPGPDAEATIASPELVEQQRKITEVDLPKDQPVETDDPDRIVSPNTLEKPREEKPDQNAAPAPSSLASVAQEATAMPSIEQAHIASKATAPEQGSGQSKLRIRSTWQRELVAHLDRHKKYPAERSRKNADILVTFRLDRTGKVVSAKILRSSGDSAFDEAALAMIRRADPVPAPPAAVADEGLTFTLPVIFRVGSKG